MGLMAIVETQLPYNQSRRDFLGIDYLFSRNRSRGGQPPRRGQEPPSGSPQPPDFWNWFNRQVSRREALGLTVLTTTLVGGGYISHKLGWLVPTAPDQTPQKPETLEDMVAKAKRMEDEFKGRDLSDKNIREKYADILAGIFVFHHPGYLSRQELKETVGWADSLDQFVRQRIASSGRTGIPTAQQLEKERSTTASTDNRRRKITVNVASDGFKQENINLIQNAPPAWNPLRELRVSLFHEFNHLAIESSDEVLFSIVDPNNKFKDKRIEGFRFMGVDERGSFAGALNDLHEAVIELLARDLSQSYFGSYYSNYPTEITGEDLTVVIDRLKQILQVVGITHQELATLHKNSNLREFLLKISDKVGVSVDAPLENRIRFGSIIAGAIERNDQRTLQSYINQVISR